MATRVQAASPAYANFEPSQTNPIRLSADGTRLFAVNTANNSLSVFNVTTPAQPTLLVEIPVGLGPVSVNPLSDDVAWVVNQVSNSISVISVSKGIVTATINVKVPIVPLATGMSGGEPMDVVFAGALAYVSVSRAHQIATPDAVTPDVLTGYLAHCKRRGVQYHYPGSGDHSQPIRGQPASHGGQSGR